MSEHERIEAVLARIRPLLQADGVDVELIEVRDDSASVRLTGLCAGCGTAPLNFHTKLEGMLREEIEGFHELRLVTDGAVPRPQPAKAGLKGEASVKKRQR